MMLDIGNNIGKLHRIPVSDVQLLMWYGRREEMRQAGLPSSTSSAFIVRYAAG